MLVARNGRSDSLTLEGSRPRPGAGNRRIAPDHRHRWNHQRDRARAGQGRLVARAGLRRPARPPAHSGPRGRGDDRLGDGGGRGGGYCAILAMPNTEPVVDSRPFSAAPRARAGGDVPVGFMAAITKGLRGEELTEMAELAANGAAGFTDDGSPSCRQGCCAARSQYSAVTGPPPRAALRGADAPRGGQMHEGAVSAELGIGRLSVDRRERHGRARPRARRLRARPSTSCTCRRASRSRRSARRRRRRRGDGRGDAAPSRPHRRGRSLAGPEREDEPAAPRGERPRSAASSACATERSLLATDHAPHARQEKDVPFEEAPFGVTGLETAFAALNTQLVCPACSRSRRCSSGCRPGLPAPSGSSRRGSRSAHPRTSSCSTSTRSGR